MTADLDTLQAVLGEFVDDRVVAFDQLDVGVSNEAFAVRCSSGRRYVLRKIRLQTVESVRAEATIQQLLTARGVGTPVYLRGPAGEATVEVAGATFTAAPFVDGEHPEQTSLALVHDMGRVLATMHIALDQSVIGIGFNTGQWHDPRNVELDIAHIDGPAHQQLAAEVAETRHVVTADLPLAVIHGEFASNNFFARDDRVSVVFDFETVQYAPRLIDLAFTYVSVVYDGLLAPRSVLEELIAGYDETAELPVTDAERDHLPAAVRFVSTAAATWCIRRGWDEYGQRFVATGRLAST